MAVLQSELVQETILTGFSSKYDEASGPSPGESVAEDKPGDKKRKELLEWPLLLASELSLMSLPH